jgi:membrane associated rhomboid family serine protease
VNLSDAPATYALILATVAASLYALFAGGRFVADFAFNVGAVRRGQQYRYLTSAFLHADLFHLLLNMLTLWSFGPDMERLLDTDGFVLLYFGSMIAGGLMIMAVNKGDPGYSAIGASGATSGVVIGFCLFKPFEPLVIFPIPIPIPAVLFGVLFVLLSAQLMRAPGKIISHEGHLGGALGGFILTALMKPEAILQWLP